MRVRVDCASSHATLAASMEFLDVSTCFVSISNSTCPAATTSPAFTLTAVTSPPALGYMYTMSAGSMVPTRSVVSSMSPICGVCTVTTGSGVGTTGSSFLKIRAITMTAIITITIPQIMRVLAFFIFSSFLSCPF